MNRVEIQGEFRSPEESIPVPFHIKASCLLEHIRVRHNLIHEIDLNGKIEKSNDHVFTFNHI